MDYHSTIDITMYPFRPTRQEGLDRMTQVVHQIGVQQQQEQQQQHQQLLSQDQHHDHEQHYLSIQKKLEEEHYRNLDLSFYQLKIFNDETEQYEFNSHFVQRFVQVLEEKFSSTTTATAETETETETEATTTNVKLNLSRNDLTSDQPWFGDSEIDHSLLNQVLKQKIEHFNISHNDLQSFDLVNKLKEQNRALTHLNVAYNRLQSFGTLNKLNNDGDDDQNSENEQAASNGDETVVFEKLTIVNLAHNRKLSHLHRNLSLMMPNIVELDLSHASLTTRVVFDSLFKVSHHGSNGSNDHCYHPLSLLKILRLSQNRLTGANFPYGSSNNDDEQVKNDSIVAVYPLPSMQELYLEDNEICDINDEWLQSMTQLRVLSLSHNKLRRLNASLFDENVFSELHSLFVDHNQIEHIPRVVKRNGAVGDGSKMVDLRLQKNLICEIEEGQLFSQWPQLTNILLNNNRLTQLPEDVGCLTRIEELYLQCNQLTSLPSSIGQLTQLKELDLYSNKLQTIPNEIGKLTLLKKLMLDNNELVSMPTEIINLTNLQLFSFRNNDNLQASPYLLAMRTDK